MSMSALFHHLYNLLRWPEGGIIVSMSRNISLDSDLRTHPAVEICVNALFEVLDLSVKRHGKRDLVLSQINDPENVVVGLS